jgi:predicted SnoaL-like aldol condensation-catalyzing enzyme
MKKIILICCALTLVVSLVACSKMEENEMKELTNLEKAVALIESIGTTNQEPASYVNPDKYIQHNLMVADGLEGFGAVLANLPEGSYAKVVRAFEDGEFVFLHTEYDFFGPKVGFDIFRFEDGLIVEHWDNLAEIAQPNPSGRTQLDGAIELTDLDQTAANKALVQGFIDDVLMNGAPEKITDYVSTETYIQHNTGIADGLSGLGEALQSLAEAGMPLVYSKNHMLLGQGNFVLAVGEGKFLNKDVAFYDLFRIEDGKIVEHWDVIENILEQSEWQNENGKF